MATCMIGISPFAFCQWACSNTQGNHRLLILPGQSCLSLPSNMPPCLPSHHAIKTDKLCKQTLHKLNRGSHVVTTSNSGCCLTTVLGSPNLGKPCRSPQRQHITPHQTNANDVARTLQVGWGWQRAPTTDDEYWLKALQNTRASKRCDSQPDTVWLG